MNRKAAATDRTKQFRLLIIKNPHQYYKRHKKRVIRYGLVMGNLAIVLVAIFAVVRSSGGNAANYSALNTAEETKVSSPLDQLSASEIAANIALMTKAPEAEAILSQSNLVWAELNSATRHDTSGTVQLQQVMSGDIKTKADIVSYTTVEGDTLEALAARFGVTSDSIRWSNNLTNSRLRAGTVLQIPPINGIVYKVKQGDTPASLATRYQANEALIIRFNDAEVSGLVADELIVVPDGRIVVQAAPRAVSSLSYRSSFSSSATFITRYTSYSNPMPYGRGWCTDWASYRSAQLGNHVANVPGGLGNAISWRRAGLKSVPIVGAVVYFHMGGLGHVGVVEEVSPDSTMIKFSDMNGLAGWGNAAKTNDWVPASSYSYIY